MTLIYKIYQLLIVLPLGILATIVTSLAMAIGSTIGSAHYWGYYPGRIWSWFMCRLLLLPIKVEGKENIDAHTSYVFVANHQGPMDIFLVYGFLGRNFKWMMKKDIRKMPLIGLACERAKHIFVDKSGPKKIHETIENARATLQNGTSLVVFPEGSRTFTGHMGIFRKGAFQLANDIGLPIVPITIDGSFDVLRRQDGFNFVNHHAMRMVIHKPIYLNEKKTSEELQGIINKVYGTIMAELPENYQGYIKNEDQ